MPTTHSLEKFFGPKRLYAVLGASNDPNKFGYKILEWYTARKLPVVPINAREANVCGLPAVATIDSVRSKPPSFKENPDAISISVVTPPNVSTQVINSLRTDLPLPIKAIWFQPGSYDKETLTAAEKKGISTIIADGNCILVQGDGLITTPNKL